MNLTDSELRHALLLMHHCRFGEVECGLETLRKTMSERHFLSVRSSLRKKRLIDRLKVGPYTRWYLNPLVFRFADNLPKQVVEHFKKDPDIEAFVQHGIIPPKHKWSRVKDPLLANLL